MSERQYDAGVDLHDSYYAAVAELRQRHVNGLPIVPPEATKIEQAKADFIISYARRVKDWPLMEQAIELKIDEQQDFVGWWDENVRSPGNPSIMSVTDIISAPRATELTGFLPKQVSRWRKHLSDQAKYRAQQILAAYRKAGLEPLSSHRTENTGEYEWYTPARFIEAAREVMGEIDLDPATHFVAQQTVRALNFYTDADDGLARPWHGRVWLNPPYAQPLIAQFVEKLVEEVSARHVDEAIMLTLNNTDTGWFHHGEAAADLICFTRGRISFLDADGVAVESPTQGNAFFYYGPHGVRFRKVFSRFGFIR